jgi:hypothetical protein
MSCIPDVATTMKMYALYNEGYSLAQVGAAFGVTRQSVYDRFHVRGLALRPKQKPLPFIMWNSVRYSRRAHGYFARTSGTRSYLHRDVWEHSNGPIPGGYDVHHRDGNKENNALPNLELLTVSDHGKKHGFAGNQVVPSTGRRPIKT